MRVMSRRSFDQPGELVDLPVDYLQRPARLLPSGRGVLEHVQAVPDRREGVAKLVRERGEELVLPRVGLDQAGVGVAERTQHLDPLHRRGDLVCHGPHQLDLVRLEAGASPRAERERPDQVALCDQRVAAVRLQAEGPDEAGARLVGALDVLGDDPLAVARDAAADGDAEVEPLDARRDLFRDRRRRR